MLSIDRTKPFSLEAIGATSLSGSFTIESEDPASLALSSIDLSQVMIVDILDMNLEHPIEANSRLEQNIEQLKKDGFIFLDAKIFETFLANPKNIPTDWAPMADSDALGTAAIEFRGTVFRDSNNSKISRVLTFSFDRGVWSYGHTKTKYDDTEMASFANESYGRLLRYAAVLAPPSSLDKSTQEKLLVVTEYILGQRLLNKDRDEIKKTLKENGWEDTIIHEASTLAGYALKARQFQEGPIDKVAQAAADEQLKSRPMPKPKK